jgi:hypothetical protein
MSYKILLRHLSRLMDRVLKVSNVPCVQWQCWWGALYVALSYPFAVCCLNTKRNLKILRRVSCWPSTFPHSSQLVAVSKGVCCSYMTSSCKYAFFSFLKGREKIRLVKQLTNTLLIESGASWHSEPTCLTLSVPTCPVATFLCFRLYHPQTWRKSTVLSSSNVSQKQVPFMGGTMSHVAVTKL